MENYYTKSLNSNSLRKCYEIAPIRVNQYLEAEIDFVLSKINKNTAILDLGCGYGRVTKRLLDKAKNVTGINISKDNIDLAKQLYSDRKKCEFYKMNALNLDFENKSFDLVICIQNGISAFKVDPKKLLMEAIRVTKNGGNLLFSTYSEKFWDDRLEWFEIQANKGLIGKIDYEMTKNGVIIYIDGFKATTFTEEDFNELATYFNINTRIYEVDNSSTFCEMTVN